MFPIQTAYGEGDGTDSGRAAEAGGYPEIGGSAGTGHRLFIKFLTYLLQVCRKSSYRRTNTNTCIFSMHIYIKFVAICRVFCNKQIIKQVIYFSDMDLCTYMTHK